MANWIQASNVHLYPKSQPYHGPHQKKRRQQIKGSDLATLYYAGETSPGVLCLDVESSV